MRSVGTRRLDRRFRVGYKSGVDAYKPPVLVAMVLIAASCSRPPATPSSSPQPSSTAQAWVGRWNGPEGTWLEISGADGKYSVAIMNLDAARTFPAAVSADGLSFERDGVRELIRATDGAATGMKWLAEKSDCLTVKPGEGYCRD